MDQVDVNKLPALVGATRVAGVWVTPTETLFETIAGTESIDAIVSRPEMKYWPRQDLDQWKKAIAAVRNDPKNTPARRQRFLELRRLMIKSLHDGGVRFVLGSDSPQIGNVPGFSIAHELQLVVAAGLTPYEALASGTRNVAEMFKTINEAGTVEPGKRADLLLLDANPLRDIGAVSRINGVVLKGRWLGRSEIDQRLAALAASH